MKMIECRTLHNQKKLVPRDSLIQRASVYAVICHQQKVLLVKTRFTGKYSFPGGGIEKGEEIVDALKREVKEETGIAVEVGELAHFMTDFFYYDPLDSAFHSFMFYYYCKPLTFDLLTEAEDDDAESPLWVEINSLHQESFQTLGETAINLLSRL